MNVGDSVEVNGKQGRVMHIFTQDVSVSEGEGRITAEASDEDPVALVDLGERLVFKRVTQLS